MITGIDDIGHLKTSYLRAGDATAIDQAATWLRRGLPVAFPTDTVYGVGVMPFDEAAIERLYQVKERDLSKGIPILLADPADLDRVAGSISPHARRLIELFWPGPLTLIVPRAPGLPDLISPNANIAVRIPDHRVARALIRAAGGAVAASSANLSGQRPATTGAAARAALDGRVAVVLDDGPSPGEQPSTIVDCTSDMPVVVRVGPLSAADLGIGEEPAG
ncbi:MAG: L-threonylcarbamoyladenylate synthase [Candidatus Promineofilum sp.]|uniref:L-threonylcarbamoyladenylate synthase n=1 Tax=Promineifilum sp. TaxID=2664178 RepID=UPI002411D126|nr:L-threonylcarbamoyladenylate synthase [Promineifilum sp.]